MAESKKITRYVLRRPSQNVTRSKIVWGWSTKADGPMELAPDLGKGAVGKNRSRFLKRQKLSLRRAVIADLAHGNKIVVVKKSQVGGGLPKTDGLIAGDHNLALTITVADCFPVFFFDRQTKIIGLAHCGWRGIAKNLPGKMVKQFIALGSPAKKLKAVIGPGIQACHFEVRKDVWAKFSKYPTGSIIKNNKKYIDLPTIATQLL